MFNFLINKKQSRTISNNYSFHGKGIIDVTNFGTTCPSDSLGYMCGCDIIVFPNGKIEIYSDASAKDLLESFSVYDVVKANNNINNHDPNHISEISLMTENKGLRITFQTQESKDEFWHALAIMKDSLK